MNKIPEDPAILLSFVNTQLRDRYKNLEELCEDYNIPPSEISGKLSAIGYEYSREHNRFK
jgi:hypothetical protein